MRVAVVPTRGSDRVVRKDWIHPLAARFDQVFVICRDWDYGSYPFPSNVTIVYSDATLPESRQLGSEMALEAGADLFWQIDDDVTSKDWESLIEAQELAMRNYPWLAVVETQSTVREFYTKGSDTSLYGDTVRPKLQLRWSPSQMAATRAAAYQETNGYFPYTTFEDYELGLQFCQNGWLQAAAMGMTFGLNRSKLNNNSRKNEGGIVPEERLAQTEEAIAWINRRHANLIRSFRPRMTRHGSPSQSLRLNWEAYAERAIQRWGLDEPMRELLATRIAKYRS